MNGRRAVVGLCMLCALLVSAFAAQSASAITGTTAVTCATSGVKQVGMETFNTDHCVPGEGSGQFRHWEVAENTTTNLTGQNGSEKTELKATIGGVPVILTSTSLTGTGSMKNLVDSGGENDKEHYAHGTGTIEYKGVTVNVPKCFVYKDVGGVAGAKGEVTTNLLTAKTTGVGMGLTFSPAAAGPFATFMLDDATPGVAPVECAVTNTYEVTGSVIGTPSGATVVFTHAGTTGQNTLRLGPKGSPVNAGINGSLTLKGEGTPLSVTTVTT